jgi:hypothetical protein
MVISRLYLSFFVQQCVGYPSSKIRLVGSIFSFPWVDVN